MLNSVGLEVIDLPHNEYAQGVLDMTAWMLTQTKKLTLRKELEEIRDMILKGAAQDF